MPENFSDYEDDATAAPKSDDALALLAKLGQELLARQKALAIAEDRVVEAKKAVTETAEVKIPELMKSLGLSSFRLDGGQEINVEDVFGANISAERRDAAHLWLEENGQAGIIKRRVVIAFSRDQEKQAAHLVRNLDKYKTRMEYTVERKVEPATLKKTARELMEKGELPENAQGLLGVFKKKVAKVATPGSKKRAKHDENPFD